MKHTLEECVKQSGIEMSSDTKRLSGRMAELLLRSRGDNTVKAYFSTFKRWTDFIEKKGGNSIPAQPVHVALYLTDLVDKGSSYSVVSAAKYAIKWIHQIHGYEDPTMNAFVSNIVESAKRHARKPITKKDIVDSEILVKLCDKYKHSSDLLILRDLTMILLCFSGFLRYDEVSSLKVKDIKYFDAHFSVNIEKSKTDQYRLGNEILIVKGVTSACPYSMLKKYMNLSGIDQFSSDTFLFRPCFKSGEVGKFINKNKKLSYTRARECIIARLKEVSGDLNFGLHSLRASGATVAANAHVNERCWKRHGRWKSESAKDGYVADSVESRLQVTKSLKL